jgi:hypothetical protein
MAGEVRRLYFADGVTTTPAETTIYSRKQSVVLSAETTKTITLTGYPDARDMIWMLKKPSASDFEQIQCKITTPSATSVVLDFGGFAQTGTFILLGV